MPSILDDIASEAPYVLAITSHRGGTGRTTLCAGLAWHWSQHGNKVALVDANPVSALKYLVCDPDGSESWPGVRLVAAPHGLQTTPEDADIILIDCPPITEPLCQQSLALADGVLVAIGSDPYSLASLAQAGTRFKEWLRMQPTVELLGLVVPMVAPAINHQGRGLARLQEIETLLVGPAVPVRREFRDWPLTPGSAPPPGPANDALEVLAWDILGLVQARTEVARAN
jgi:cellulose biosynthesis protein BcsQ